MTSKMTLSLTLPLEEGTTLALYLRVKRVFLLLFLSVSIAHLSWWWWKHPQTTPSAPSSVYLIKSGSEYLVAWIDEENEYHLKKFFQSQKASKYISETLNLSVSCGERPELKLEKLEMKHSGEQEQVVWKTISSPYTNRLSFLKASEARFFYESFQNGAYTPSPFGHAILFVAKSSQKRCGS